MKIAVFHELDFGGARRAANELSRALKLKGHTVDLFFVDAKKNGEEKKYFNTVYYYQFIPKQWSGGNWKVKLYKDTVELYRLYRLHRNIAKTINNGGYDFAFVQGSKFTQAPFILRFLTIKKIYFCQEPLRIAYESLFAIAPHLHPAKRLYEQVIRYILKKIDKQNIKHAEIVLANSTFSKENIYKAYGIQSTVCHLGVDMDVFYPKGKKQIDILFIGSKNEYDGYPLFQESVKHMKQKAKIMYHILGEDPYVSDTILSEYYSQSKIVICFGFNEPFGLIAIEAMACGAVVVALNEGGYKDTVKHHKTGILIEKDPAKIAKVLDSLLQDRIKLASLAKNAIEGVRKHWTWKRGAEEIIKEIIRI